MNPFTAFVNDQSFPYVVTMVCVILCVVFFFSYLYAHDKIVDGGRQPETGMYVGLGMLASVLLSILGAIIVSTAPGSLYVLLGIALITGLAFLVMKTGNRIGTMFTERKYNNTVEERR